MNSLDKELLLFVAASILFCVLTAFMLRGIDVVFFENVPTKCYVENKLVYDGVSAGLSVSSIGYTTKVIIKCGFLYMFPKKYYVSKDVKVVGEK
jgi:hypothetical protein